MISDFLNLFYFNAKNGVGVTSLKDLSSKGILEILAEPTLTTIDGEPAKFLAGGEFPFPVVQPGSAGRHRDRDHSIPGIRREAGFHALRKS